MQQGIALRGAALACAWLLGCTVETFNHSDGGLDATVPVDGAAYGDVRADADGGGPSDISEASAVEASGLVDATADVATATDAAAE
jgi:hypothetical protein